jgi:tetratricopeptide (TPR) repeat protein
MFLRTPQGQALGEAERGKLVRALGALGEAYLGKGQADWAEDVLRLGIQFGQDLSAASILFGLLGRARVESARYGEAIGLLRRALALGGEERMFLPLLARCFVERQRHVAAMACVEQAQLAGVDDEELCEIRRRAEQALGPAYAEQRAYVRSEA